MGLGRLDLPGPASRTQSQNFRQAVELRSAPRPTQELSREPGSETARARDASPHRAALSGAPSPAHGRGSLGS